MDALKLNFKLLLLGVFAFLAACSNNDSGEIDPKAKQNVLASTMLLSVKRQCLPPNIVDEEDIPWLLHYGYTAHSDNSYCLPPVDTNDGDDTVSNCIREIFVDDTDLIFLTNLGYLPGPNDDYCLVLSGGNNSGGSTSGGNDSGGSTSGGSTTGDNSGGTVSGGSTTGETSSGSTTGGNDSGGSTSGGSTTGESSGGTVSGGSTSGETSSGNTSGGNDSGGSTSGGSTTGESSGGTVSGGSTSGSTSGGSTSGGTSGGNCRANNGHGNDGDGNDASNPGHSNNGDGTDEDGDPRHHGNTCPPNPHDCTMNVIPGLNNEDSFSKCNNWNVGIDRMCSRLRTTSGRYKLRDRLELVLQVVKKIKTVSEVEVCKEDKPKFFDWLFGKNNHHSSGHKHDGRCDHSSSGPKVVCKKEKKEVISYVPICESRDTEKIKNDVIKERRLDFSDCDITGHDKKHLFVTLYSPVVSSDLPISRSSYENVRFFANDSNERGKDVLSFILYGSRENRYVNIREKIVVIIDDNPDFNNNVNKKECDQRASPLIVHINPNRDQAKYVELSSIDDGLEFDILGLNAEPKAHAPRQISWLNSDQYMFLVKPNKRGQVEGVNEMFGDNTYGPDKDFAANGFLALAKYDSNGDGLINKKDAVYSQLRLWRDVNFDGVSTSSELFTLERMSVKAIDLNYDSGFFERDIYGNETIYKSVIQYYDGSLDLIFDLWFNYKK